MTPAQATGFQTQQPQRSPLEILDEIKTRYAESRTKDTFNAIILGNLGSGKTSILKTCPKPVLIHSFDPGGTKLRDMKPLIDSGEIIVDNSFEIDSMNRPTAYDSWEREWERLRSADVFANIGTYCIDSFTTWIQSLVYAVAKKSGKGFGCLSQPDWQRIKNVVIDIVRLNTALPCNFIMTGHLQLVLDKVEGKSIVRFNSIPSLKINVPVLFDEIYVLDTENSPNGLSRTLITSNTGRFEARTRIGAGVFEVREKPDIKYLLEKAGLDTNEKT